MKKFILIAAIAMLCGAAANAQYVAGAASGSALVINGVYTINGKVTSNTPAATVYNIPIGPKGVGIFGHVGTSGSLGVTNATIRMELSVDGLNWTTSNAVVVVSFPQTGVTPFRFYTNIADNAFFGNARYLRVNSIQNTNAETLYITNLLWSVK